ncbi:retrovirus-related pol polyprotein from transposon TNT 1-94 [Tanacetum coccineum]
MKHVNTEIFKENQNLKKELKELTNITETWLNSSNKVNQCISEQIPCQRKRILGLDQLTEEPSSSGKTDLIFLKSSADDTEESIPCVENPWLSKAEGFTLPNHDTGKILPAESQIQATDPSVAITNSSASEYDSADESSGYSTLLPPLEKLVGVEPVSRPKTIKLILKSKSTFKDKTLKGVRINEPSSTPAKFDEKRGKDVDVLDMTSSEQEILTDNGTKVINNILVNFCDEKGISKNFSSSYTPNQNGVAEKKNRTLIEAARIMLLGSVFSKQYWIEAVAIYIHNHKGYLGKFDEKADDGYFLGYLLVSKAFRVFSTGIQRTKETYHVTFDESTDAIKFTKPLDDNITIAESERYPPNEYLHPYEPSQR